MKEQIYFSDSVWEVTLLGFSYRYKVAQRSKAVTLALNEYMDENPKNDLSLSILRTKARTRFISEEELLLESATND